MNLDRLKKLKIHVLLSGLITVVGIVLLVFMVTVESEPGAIPLLLIVIGIGWYFVARYKMRSQQI